MQRIFVALVLLFSVNAKASIFGEENANLAALVGLQTDELLKVGLILQNIELVLSGVNDVAAGVRESYRIYNVLKSYNFKDLLKDAKSGLYAAFPELKGIEEELKQLKGNVRAGEEGTFFSHYDRHDEPMQRLLEAGFKHAYRSTIWPVLFKDDVDSSVMRSPVDDFVNQRFKKSGQDLKIAFQNTALGMLAQKAAALNEEAEIKNRGDLQTLALSAQIEAQNLNNTTRMRDLAEQEAAMREHSEQNSKASEARVRESMSNNVDMLLRPKGMSK